MNRRPLLVLVLIAVLVGCQASAPPPAAPVNPAPAAAPAATPAVPAPADADEHEASEDAAATTAIPDTAAAIWQAIDAKRAELKTTVASGSLEQVHHQAFAIRDLVAALPAKSADLGPDAQATLANDAKFVATLASRLDETGDAGDRAATQANFDKLAALLDGMPRAK